MDFLDLSKEDFEQILNDMFEPKKITCFKKSKKWREVSAKVYTEWESTDDDGNTEISLIPDEVILRNPFEYGERAIHADFKILPEDYTKYKQFCFAKGVRGPNIDWLVNNPYQCQVLDYYDPLDPKPKNKEVKKVTFEGKTMSLPADDITYGVISEAQKSTLFFLETREKAIDFAKEKLPKEPFYIVEITSSHEIVEKLSNN